MNLNYASIRQHVYGKKSQVDRLLNCCNICKGQKWLECWTTKMVWEQSHLLSNKKMLCQFWTAVDDRPLASFRSIQNLLSCFLRGMCSVATTLGLIQSCFQDLTILGSLLIVLRIQWVLSTLDTEFWRLFILHYPSNCSFQKVVLFLVSWSLTLRVHRWVVFKDSRDCYEGFITLSLHCFFLYDILSDKFLTTWSPQSLITVLSTQWDQWTNVYHFTPSVAILNFSLGGKMVEL